MTAEAWGPAAAGKLALALVIAFACGALPWGLWIGRWFRGVDVRAAGSGNLGATNVYRTLGPALGILTLALDILKGAIPVWLTPLLPPEPAPRLDEWTRLLAGAAAVAGHVWTPLAGFKGGKGVATTVGVLLALSPPAFGVFVAVFVLAVGITRFISLGSILGSLAFAATLGIVAPGGVRSPTFVFGALIAALVIARHRENIARLAGGTERRFSFRSEGKP